MKDIRQFIQISNDLAEPLRRGFLKSIDDVERRLVSMTKEEAIEFAKKYLADRRMSNVEVMIDKNRLDLEASAHRARAWDVATEYTILDIITHIFGEALD